MTELAASTPMHAMPIEIIKAVIAITGKVKKLAKEGNNTFARYKYTSVDQFYEAIGPLMAEHGLMDMAFEQSTVSELREVALEAGGVKKSVWMTVVTDFYLYHESGAQFGPVTRTIQVPATGAQSYASAQSYLEKYFLRNLFKIPTGDKDEIDEAAQEGLPTGGNVTSIRKGKKITDTQVAMIRTALNTLHDKSVEKGMLEFYKVEKLADLSADDVSHAMKKLALKMDIQAKAGLADLDQKMAAAGVDPAEPVTEREAQADRLDAMIDAPSPR